MRIIILNSAFFIALAGAGGSCCGCHATTSRVHQVLQLLAGLEKRNLLGGDFYPVAGLGIASDAWFPLPGAEAAKAADLDLVAGAERAHDAVEDRFDDDFAV